MQTKHMFAKVPLKDDPNFASVNVRELVMLTTVLPQMQAYLDSECEGFFKLPMPDVHHCYYDGKGKITFLIHTFTTRGQSTTVSARIEPHS